MICNPPYGERLGDEASLLYLYQNLGERLRQSCIGWSAGVFTGAPELGKRMGIRSHKQYAFWNGALACKLLMIQSSRASSSPASVANATTKAWRGRRASRHD